MNSTELGESSKVDPGRASGRLALVTGGSRGIGLAISTRLVDEGAAVVVAARSIEACRAAVESLRARGGTAWALGLDVGSPDAGSRALDGVEELTEGRPLDWLVNNAGVAESAPLLPKGDVEEVYRKHMEVNFHGPRRLVEAFLPSWRDRGSGGVVQVASSAGLRGYSYVAAYAASKHALLGYTRSAALELAKARVALNAVCPHYVETEMTARSVARIVETTGRSEAEALETLAAQNPSGRLIQPEEVADAVLDLLVRGRSGGVLELDGGEPRWVDAGFEIGRKDGV